VKLPDKPGGIPNAFFSMPGANISCSKIVAMVRKQRDEGF
jgi:hypothetical protein